MVLAGGDKKVLGVVDAGELPVGTTIRKSKIAWFHAIFFYSVYIFFINYNLMSKYKVKLNNIYRF